MCRAEALCLLLCGESPTRTGTSYDEAVDRLIDVQKQKNREVLRSSKGSI